MLTVRVAKTTKKNQSGIAYLDSAPIKIYPVAAVYESGKVRTSSGDVWEVISNQNKHESDFIAVC